MKYQIDYYSEKVQTEIAKLPKTLVARYLRLAERMEMFGPDLGMPHSRAMKGGLFELRLMGAEGIARVFYCTMVARRIVMLHCFIKKTNRTPSTEIAIAERRMMEVRHANP
jgi:phage-related protein